MGAGVDGEHIARSSDAAQENFCYLWAEFSEKGEFRVYPAAVLVEAGTIDRRADKSPPRVKADGADKVATGRPRCFLKG